MKGGAKRPGKAAVRAGSGGVWEAAHRTSFSSDGKVELAFFSDKASGHQLMWLLLRRPGAQPPIEATLFLSLDQAEDLLVSLMGAVTGARCSLAALGLDSNQKPLNAGTSGSR